MGSIVLRQYNDVSAAGALQRAYDWVSAATSDGVLSIMEKAEVRGNWAAMVDIKDSLLTQAAGFSINTTTDADFQATASPGLQFFFTTLYNALVAAEVWSAPSSSTTVDKATLNGHMANFKNQCQVCTGRLAMGAYTLADGKSKLISLNSQYLPANAMGNVGDYCHRLYDGTVYFYEKTDSTTWTLKGQYKLGADNTADVLPDIPLSGFSTAIQTAVNDATAYIANIANDGIITSVEKKGIIPSYQSAVNDFFQLHNTAVTLGIDTTAFVAAGEAVNTAMKPIFGTDLSDNIDYHLLGEDYSLTDNGKSRQWFTDLWAIYWHQWALLKQAIDYMSGGAVTWPNILGVPPELASVSLMQDTFLDAATTMAENETRLPGLNFSVSNFNDRNDRITEVPANPTIATDGTAIDYLYNSNGTANINIAWSYGTGTPATNIDGFIVHVKQSSSATAIDLTVDLSSASHYQILPYMRDYTIVGLAPRYYYTVGVEAFRVVDPDINSEGILRSAIIQPTIAEENPIFLSHTVPAPSTVTLTII